MRSAVLFLSSIVLLGGCAGNVADYVGSRTSIVGPQLIRYGLTEPQARCVGERLSASLTPLQLRLLARSAETLKQGYYEPGKLNVRDLMHVASSMSDGKVGVEVARATAACDALPEMSVRRADQAETPSEAEPTPSAEAPTPDQSAPGVRPPVWLNLGAAPTGQSIAVEASSLEQEGTLRKAWFRLTNPQTPGPTGVSYLLRIDCSKRTIEALAHRRQDPTGAVAEQNEYNTTDGPGPIEGGTVMEIAFLALCT